MHAHEQAEDSAVPAPRQRHAAPVRPGGQAAVISLQRTAGNAAVSAFLAERSARADSAGKIAQRQDTSDSADDEAVDGSTPVRGAPPIITEDVEFSADSESEDEAVQAFVDPVVQRQTQRPAGQPPARPPAGCPAVTLANYPRLNPGGPFEADTAFTWSLRNRRFTVIFDRANSWVRPRAVRNRQLERHEQYHLRLACAIATIANDMLARGDDEQTVTAQLRNSLRIHTEQYDDATDHGTIADQQTAFEQAIDAGLVQMAGP